MDPHDRVRLWQLVQRFKEGRLKPLEQAELREILARYHAASLTQSLPALIEHARLALGMEVIRDFARERATEA